MIHDSTFAREELAHIRAMERAEFARRHPEWAEVKQDFRALGWGETAAGELAEIHIELKERA